MDETPALAVVLDLDGTIVDTASDLAAALNFALAEEGLDVLGIDAVRGMIGDGTRALLERGLAAHARPVSPERFEELHDRLSEHYIAHIADGSVLYPEVAATLRRLSSGGARLSVCTNKPERMARAILVELGLSELMASLCGGDTCLTRKPDPEPLRTAIIRAGGDVRRAVMVGDSVNDVKTARALGIPVILVDYGYTDIPASELGADAVVSRFSEIESVIKDMELVDSTETRTSR